MEANVVLEFMNSVLAGFGGGAVVVFAKWLLDLNSKRILQNEQGRIASEVEKLKGELQLDRFSYEKHVSEVVDYFDMAYLSYQMCQLVANGDITRRPDQPDINNRDDYLKKIDDVSETWKRKQASVRLLLPSDVLRIHEKYLDALNAFTNQVKKGAPLGSSFCGIAKPLFRPIHELKNELEDALRAYLRRSKI